MPETDFLPSTDSEFAVWRDNLAVRLPSRLADVGLTNEDMAAMQADNAVLHTRITAANPVLVRNSYG